MDRHLQLALCRLASFLCLTSLFHSIEIARLMLVGRSKTSTMSTRDGSRSHSRSTSGIRRRNWFNDRPYVGAPLISGKTAAYKRELERTSADDPHGFEERGDHQLSFTLDVLCAYFCVHVREAQMLVATGGVRWRACC